MIKNWGAATVVLLIFLGISVLPWTGPLPRNHSPRPESNAQSSSVQEHKPSDFIVLVRRLDRLLKRHNESVSAASSVLLVILTGLLAWKTSGLNDATRRLQDLAAAQGEDTKKSIQAAQRLADAATLTAGADRAWMSFENLHPGQAESGHIDGNLVIPIMYFYIRWINCGRSPAMSVESAILFEIAPIDRIKPPHFTLPGNKNPGGAIAIGPGLIVNTSQIAIGGNQVNDFVKRKIKLYIYSKSRYTDVYNSKTDRITEVCLEVSANGTRPHPIIGVQPNLLIFTVGDQNTAS